MSRFAAIALSTLRIEIAQSGLAAPSGPLAIVIAKPGAVANERLLLGNTRLDEVSAEAYALGVRPSQTIAAARARVANLRVRMVETSAVRKVLSTLAEVALAFGASASFESLDAMGDIVSVDVTGCAHLFASEDDEPGEATLATRLSERVQAMGHANRVAIAGGPRIAAAIARFARTPGPIVVPLGHDTEALYALPLSALPLDDETRHWLRAVGIRTVGDLERLPKRPLGSRLGTKARAVMQLLEGDDRARPAPFVPSNIPEDQIELEQGIETTEPLLFVTKRLCDRLAASLEGRGQATSRMVLVCKLDRAMATDSPVDALEVRFPSPMTKAADLFAVLRARLERHVIAAPIVAVTLRAHELGPRHCRPLDLFVPEAKADVALPRLVGELIAELGEACVGKLALADTWVHERRSTLMPFEERDAGVGENISLFSGAPEPTRVLFRMRSPFDTTNRCRIACHDSIDVQFVEKVEELEWWKSERPARIFCTTWLPELKSMAWIAVDEAMGAREVFGWLD